MLRACTARQPANADTVYSIGVLDLSKGTTVYFSPTQPAEVKRGNWIQTMPGRGWFTYLRFYSPLQPFFTKEWRPSKIEPVR